MVKYKNKRTEIEIEDLHDGTFRVAYETFGRKFQTGIFVVNDSTVTYHADDNISASMMESTARALRREYDAQVDIFYHGKHKHLAPLQKKKSHVVRFEDWEKIVYNDGCYYINKFNTQIMLWFKKKTTAQYVMQVISCYLDTYFSVHVSTTKNYPKPQDILLVNKRDSRDDIEFTVCAHLGIKPEIKLDAEDDNAKIPFIDPVMLAKKLTLTCKPNQNINEAKEKAQQMANSQRLCIKLLDSGGKFICDIYPTITNAEYASRYAAQHGNEIKNIIYRNVATIER